MRQPEVRELRLRSPDPSRITITRRIDGKYFVRQGRYYEPFATYEQAIADAQKLFEAAGGEGRVTLEDRVGAVTESTIRRRADRAGYRVIKSRKINVTPDDQGEYMLIDVDTNLPVLGYQYDAELADVAAFLSESASDAPH